MTGSTAAVSNLSALSRAVRSFLAEEAGAAAIEYAAIAAFLSIAIASVVYELGSEVLGFFESVRDSFL